jgi:hypothetical protein
VYVSPAENDVLYTATDHTVWVKNLDNGSVAQAGNGLLASGPSAIYNGTTVIIFGEGTDHKLWSTQRLATGGYANWSLLGGALTSQPGATAAGTGYWVFVAGTDGAVWLLEQPGSFRRIGGRVLAGTGPAAAWLMFPGPGSPNQETYVAVVGTNRELYIALPFSPAGPGFSSAGGQTTATPALTADISNDNLVPFVRGTDNAAYYLNGVWKSLGGRLNSGLTATTDQLTGNVYVYALGTDNQVYQKTGNLSRSDTFSPTWTKVTG